MSRQTRIITVDPIKITLQRDVISRECITYKSFISKAQLTARHLLRHGCRKGDVIVLFAPNSIDWLVVVAASFRIGLVPAGINSVLKAGINPTCLISECTGLTASLVRAFRYM